jgi:hypothetical protein
MLQYCRQPELLFPWFAMPKKNIFKSKARPKRSIDNPGTDHELGLWVDYDLLRKHQGRTSQIVIHSPFIAANNRYLELADLALGNEKTKKKSKSAASSE